MVFNGVEIKISQLADDTTWFIKNEKSLQNLIKTFKTFNICSGLKINIDKTSARRLGGIKLSNEKLFGLNWSQEPVHTLGIYVSGNEADHYNSNFKPKIMIKSKKTIWKRTSWML